jgi:hypothetical protein
LGSINVGYYVQDGKMDWAAFKADIHMSTHFLDNIIDVNKYPLKEIDSLSKRIRRIGSASWASRTRSCDSASRTTPQKVWRSARR